MVKENIGEYVSISTGFISRSSLLILILLLILISTVQINKTQADKVKCSDFQSHYDAQKAFDSSPSFYKKLDRDHDGLVCEDMK